MVGILSKLNILKKTSFDFKDFFEIKTDGSSTCNCMQMIFVYSNLVLC